MFFESNGKGFYYAEIGHYYNSFFQLGNVIRNNVLLYINKRTPEIDPIYNREAFDEYGDLQSQPFKGGYENCNDPKNFRVSKFKPSNYFISHLIQLDEYCKKNDIKLLYSFPPIAKSAFNYKKATELYNRLLDAKIAVINKPENSTYCDSLFIGTNYHLCKEGRTIYISKLIKDLRSSNVIGK
jgi:hypothetical protein